MRGRHDSLLRCISFLVILSHSVDGGTSSILDIVADLVEEGDHLVTGSPQREDPLSGNINEHRNHHGQNIKPDYYQVERSNNSRTSTRDQEKYVVPMLTGFVGDNNQLIEYMTATVIARATKRTLCLVPFFSGPSKHSGRLPKGGSRGSSLAMEDRYDINTLAQFVRSIAPLHKCLQRCGNHIDSFWWLRYAHSSLPMGWKWDQNITKHDLASSFVKWTSTNDIAATLGSFNNERCVALGGTFPGLRWRGAYLASSMFLRPSSSIMKVATTIQDMAIGINRRFLAVHWRFEESYCKGHELGLCFLRCGDGSVIDSGLHPELQEWKHGCPRDRAYQRGVSISKADLIGAIRNKAMAESLNAIYLATDGWMRGQKETALVKEVVETLRKSGLTVVGLWKINGLPNFPNGQYFDQSNFWSASNITIATSGHTISQVEQEICYRAHSFLGSGESTWSLSVFRSRLAARRKKQIKKALGSSTQKTCPLDGFVGASIDVKNPHKGLKGTSISNCTRDGNHIGSDGSDSGGGGGSGGGSGGIVDETTTFIEGLLHDTHAAGMQCRYRPLFNHAKVDNVPIETYKDEAPDGWLDMEACETMRINGKKTSCKIAACL